MSTTEGSAEDLPTLVDTALLRDLPTTTRGTRTRAALVAAARVVFERDGFIDSRLTDITKRGQVLHGTFYTLLRQQGAGIRRCANEVRTCSTGARRTAATKSAPSPSSSKLDIVPTSSRISAMRS